MIHRSRKSLVAAVSMTSLVMASTAFATDYTWTGNSNGAWNNSANWSPATGTPNGLTDTATFTGGQQTSVSIGTSETVSALSFDANVTSGFTVSGGALSFAPSATITKQATSATTTDTLASTLAFIGNATVTNNDTGNFGAGRALTLSGAMTGTGTLHVAGGTAGVQFSGNSAGYVGPVSIDSGFVLPTTNTALGTGTITMNTGSTLYFNSSSNLTNNWVIAGNAQWGSYNGNTQSGNVAVNSGATWNIDNGGGNYLGLPGVISGAGNILFTAANTTFSGSTSNTLSGLIDQAATPTNTAFATLTLAKTGGAIAVAGNLEVANNGIVAWGGNNEVATTSNVQLAGGLLQLDGYTNSVGTLTLSGSANIDVSGGNSALHFANSSGTSWTGKQVLINNWSSAQTVSVGTTAAGLTTSQLSLVGFSNPAGLSAGLYHAAISSSGVLTPTGSAVQPTNPLWDMSPAAVAARTAVYSKPGLSELSSSGTPLAAGTSISFFGDSITWLNGYVTDIQNALSSGSGSSGLNVQLHNRGINGGGVANILNGSPNNAFDGGSNNAAQAPFSSVIAADKSNVAVIFIGVNDVRLLGTSASTYQTDLTQLIDEGEAAGTKMVLCTVELAGEMPDGTNSIVGNYDAQMDQFAQIARNVAGSTGATLVDIRTAAQDYEENNNYTLNLDGSLNYASDGILTYDGIHPTTTGASFLANLISDGIYQAETAAVPEPASLSMVIIAGLALRGERRRRTSNRL